MVNAKAQLGRELSGAACLGRFDPLEDSTYDCQVGHSIPAFCCECGHYGCKVPSSLAAPSFNGRTADSGSAYRGSNPWGAANLESCTYLNINPHGSIHPLS